MHKSKYFRERVEAHKKSAPARAFHEGQEDSMLIEAGFDKQIGQLTLWMNDNFDKVFIGRSGLWTVVPDRASGVETGGGDQDLNNALIRLR